MNEREQKALEILQDIYVQNLEQNERIYALIQEYEQENPQSQDSQSDEFPFKKGDVVQLSESGKKNCGLSQSFVGKAIFRGQSKTVGHCTVLEMLEDEERKSSGGGQNGWWNFEKENLKHLEKVSSDKPSEYKNGDRVKLVTDYWGDGSYNPIWGGSEGNILGTIDGVKQVKQGESIIKEQGEYTEYHIAWDNGKGNSSYKYDHLELATQADEEKAKEPLATPVKKTRKKRVKASETELTTAGEKVETLEAGAGGTEESAPKSEVASSEKVFCTLCNKEHTRGTHD